MALYRLVITPTREHSLAAALQASPEAHLRVCSRSPAWRCRPCAFGTPAASPPGSPPTVRGRVSVYSVVINRSVALRPAASTIADLVGEPWRGPRGLLGGRAWGCKWGRGTGGGGGGRLQSGSCLCPTMASRRCSRASARASDTQFCPLAANSRQGGELCIQRASLRALRGCRPHLAYAGHVRNTTARRTAARRAKPGRAIPLSPSASCCAACKRVELLLRPVGRDGVRIQPDACLLSQRSHQLARARAGWLARSAKSLLKLSADSRQNTYSPSCDSQRSSRSG